MVIRTRHQTVMVGPGPYNLALSHDQIALIAALISMVRLGTGHRYREAAYNLNSILEAATGDAQFVHDAYNAVAPMVTIDTNMGPETYDGSNCTIEV